MEANDIKVVSDFDKTLVMMVKRKTSPFLETHTDNRFSFPCLFSQPISHFSLYLSLPTFMWIPSKFREGML